VLLVIGLAAGLAGLVLSAGAAAIQFLPRNFSSAQRQQIMAWEIGKRWRSWPAGRIFPSSIGYHLPGSAFGGGGSHFCLGASLARLETRCLFGELLDRIHDLEPNGPVERLHSWFINGPRRMPVRFRAARVSAAARG